MNMRTRVGSTDAVAIEIQDGNEHPVWTEALRGARELLKTNKDHGAVVIAVASSAYSLGRTGDATVYSLHGITKTAGQSSIRSVKGFFKKPPKKEDSHVRRFCEALASGVFLLAVFMLDGSVF